MIITTSRTKAAELADQSIHKAVKWLRDSETGTTYFWKPEESSHADVAQGLSIAEYTKGLGVIEDHKDAS